MCTPALFILIIQDDIGNTALIAAVDKGHFHIAEILVKNGANVNYRNKVRALIRPRYISTCMRNVANDKAWYYAW